MMKNVLIPQISGLMTFFFVLFSKSPKTNETVNHDSKREWKVNEYLSLILLCWLAFGNFIKRT